MKNTFILTICIIVLALHACKQEIPNPLPDEARLYLGTYQVTSIQQSGLHVVYDSVGNIAFYEERADSFSDPLLTISQVPDTDSLLINGLVFDFQGRFREEVKAMWESDTLYFYKDRSTSSFRNNFIRGKAWLSADSIQLRYYWDKSDTYSTGTIPEFGRVVGRGLRIN